MKFAERSGAKIAYDAPHAGARIEIFVEPALARCSVTPPTRGRELKYIDVGRTLPSEYDAPHAGARIEINIFRLV